MDLRDKFEIVLMHAGANQSRRDEVDALFRQSGLPISDEEHDQITLYGDHPEAWFTDRSVPARVSRSIQNSLTKQANYYMPDYEPGKTGVDWNGSSKDGMDPVVLDIINPVVKSVRSTVPGARVGPYGYPHNTWFGPHVTDNSFSATEKMVTALHPDCFYVPVYVTHNVGPHNPSSGSISPVLLQRRLTGTIGTCRLVSARAGYEIEPLPMFQSRVRNPGKSWNLTAVSSETANVWASQILSLGVRRMVIWCEYPKNDHPDPDRYVDDRLSEHVGIIPGLVEAVNNHFRTT